jgi:Flp pilus assembly protein TadD
MDHGTWKAKRALEYLRKIARFLHGDDAKAPNAPDIAAGNCPDPEVSRAADRAIADANRALAEKDYATAAARFASAIELRHDDADAHFGLGLACYKEQKDEDAADCFLMAAHFSPLRAEPHYQLALLAQRAGDVAAAIDHVDRALKFRPDYADAHNLLGACVLAMGIPGRAAESFGRAVELDPGNARFHSNLGYVLIRDLDEFERGKAHIETALQLDSADIAIRCNYCSVLGYQGRTDEVIAVCDRLLETHPDLKEARLNRALALLKQARFGEAWPDYESRRHTRSNYLPRPYTYPDWKGESLTGKTVLVYAEQGLGDEIMFASCLPDILKQAGRCIVDCSPRLESLFARSFPAAIVHGAEQTDRDVSWLQSLGMVDFQIAAGSMPGLVRQGIANYPLHNGYLHADPTRVEYWKGRLNANGEALKVGIAWRGGMTSTRRSLRSLKLAQLLPLLQMHGVHFVSLQHDATAEEFAAISASKHVMLDHWPEVVADLDETAALVSALDLVITVCSATVHLSGALGRRAWVMVPAVAEWRYLESGDAMPWYPSIRMYRQAQAGDWQSVVGEIARELSPLRPA